ncbi:site-2 protease family protein [Methylophilus medardicus]|uniref:Site-2 protease family protein n=1 Tax=Methylophilus medardicus TaxID=2588534 RepID=A0A5B8CQZ8_9PROT|nr:site-2 protease family protein [Methylophilus medardicus]QDC43704.1 site-2 protease family protein [Methylophilus medardicus]QDC48711.1 site-2 protease family protein [Methylophilus medardicus]QDC52416.1 site-2 protease family protein [Methylophilus medardicus]
MEMTVIQKIAAYALPVLFAITVHEAAHGYAAKFFGDLTAERLGRITLNPLKHIDPIGTILLPALSVLLGGVLFGWAKPVPVNFAQLRRPKQDMLWVALAGPASNFVMALAWGLILARVDLLPPSSHVFMTQMSLAGIQINLVLLVLNLFPLPPLDGGRIAVSLLPMRAAIKFAQIERYGMLILIALLFTGILGILLSPVLRFFQHLLTLLII